MSDQKVREALRGVSLNDGQEADRNYAAQVEGRQNLCQSCKLPVHAEATKCQHCGEPVNVAWKIHNWSLLLAGALVAWAIYYIWTTYQSSAALVDRLAG